MGRRQRGEDIVDVQRRADKKRRSAHKRKQADLTKLLQRKVDDHKATSESIAAQLAKLDAFRMLTPAQKTLKDSLIEKHEALLEIEKMQREFELERKARHARGEFTSSDDDDADAGEDSDDGDEDDGAGPVPPPPPQAHAAMATVAVRADDPWAELMLGATAAAHARATPLQQPHAAMMMRPISVMQQQLSTPQFTTSMRPVSVMLQQQQQQVTTSVTSRQATEAAAQSRVLNNSATATAVAPATRGAGAADAGSDDQDVADFLASLENGNSSGGDDDEDDA